MGERKGSGTSALYRGLIIGGPGDGVIVENAVDWLVVYRHHDKVEMLSSGDPMPSALQSTGEIVRYNHVELIAAGEKFGFWVRNSALGYQQYIMRQLVTSYERKNGTQDNGGR